LNASFKFLIGIIKTLENQSEHLKFSRLNSSLAD